ncbi:MAG TPA: Xaa-Pro peptidase family protein [Acidimicrobiales bacterium]|nr:Xaa-Pro peptidase family protein [Acidimicrobiales bacterium]
MSIPPMDVAGRLGRLVPTLDDAGCDALLVTNLTNIRYLTGFTGSAGMLLVGADRAALFTDGRYQTQAAEQLETAGVKADISIGGLAAQRQALGDRAGGIGRLGLEAASVTWATQRMLDQEVLPSVELVPTVGLVEGLRRVKDAGEEARIAEAASIADRALAEVLGLVAGGSTEAEVGAALDHAMRRLGAQGPAFETIVAAGPNGAKPHARPSTRRIEADDLVVIDFGAVYDGYRSDMTRTLCLGRPGPEARRMHEVVVRSQAAGVAAVRSGVAAAEVDGVCRAVIAEAGWADAFVHGTGHGVGLDIHEAPSVAATSTDTLEAGSAVTVEPGVYLAGAAGVRIEDTVVVTGDGCRTLTGFPKDMDPR